MREKLSTAIKSPGWYDDCKGRIQREKFSMIEFVQLILAPSLSALIWQKKTATANYFFFFTIYPIYFFWPVAENLYYVPFPWRRQDTVI